jgi:hypothetical protein
MAEYKDEKHCACSDAVSGVYDELRIVSLRVYVTVQLPCETAKRVLAQAQVCGGGHPLPMRHDNCHNAW